MQEIGASYTSFISGVTVPVPVHAFTNLHLQAEARARIHTDVQTPHLVMTTSNDARTRSPSPHVSLAKRRADLSFSCCTHRCGKPAESGGSRLRLCCSKDQLFVPSGEGKSFWLPAVIMGGNPHQTCSRLGDVINDSLMACCLSGRQAPGLPDFPIK